MAAPSLSQAGDSQQENDLTIVVWNVNGDSSDSGTASQRAENMEAVLNNLDIHAYRNLFFLCSDQISGPKHTVLTNKLGGRPFGFPKEDAEVYTGDRTDFNVTYVEPKKKTAIFDRRVAVTIITQKRSRQTQTKKSVLIVSWHGPTKERKQESLHDLIKRVNQIKEGQKCAAVVIGGDFNLTPEVVRGVLDTQFAQLHGAVADDYTLPKDRDNKIDFLVYWPKWSFKISGPEVVLDHLRFSGEKRIFDHPILVYSLSDCSRHDLDECRGSPDVEERKWQIIKQGADFTFSCSKAKVTDDRAKEIIKRLRLGVPYRAEVTAFVGGCSDQRCRTETRFEQLFLSCKCKPRILVDYDKEVRAGHNICRTVYGVFRLAGSIPIAHAASRPRRPRKKKTDDPQDTENSHTVETIGKSDTQLSVSAPTQHPLVGSSKSDNIKQNQQTPASKATNHDGVKSACTTQDQDQDAARNTSSSSDQGASTKETTTSQDQQTSSNPASAQWQPYDKTKASASHADQPDADRNRTITCTQSRQLETEQSQDMVSDNNKRQPWSLESFNSLKVPDKWKKRNAADGRDIQRPSGALPHHKVVGLTKVGKEDTSPPSVQERPASSATVTVPSGQAANPVPSSSGQQTDQPRTPYKSPSQAQQTRMGKDDMVQTTPSARGRRVADQETGLRNISTPRNNNQRHAHSSTSHLSSAKIQKTVSEVTRVMGYDSSTHQAGKHRNPLALAGASMNQDSDVKTATRAGVKRASRTMSTNRKAEQPVSALEPRGQQFLNMAIPPSFMLQARGMKRWQLTGVKPVSQPQLKYIRTWSVFLVRNIHQARQARQRPHGKRATTDEPDAKGRRLKTYARNLASIAATRSRTSRPCIGLTEGKGDPTTPPLADKNPFSSATTTKQGTQQGASITSRSWLPQTFLSFPPTVRQSPKKTGSVVGLICSSDSPTSQSSGASAQRKPAVQPHDKTRSSASHADQPDAKRSRTTTGTQKPQNRTSPTTPCIDLTRGDDVPTCRPPPAHKNPSTSFTARILLQQQASSVASGSFPPSAHQSPYKTAGNTFSSPNHTVQAAGANLHPRPVGTMPQPSSTLGPIGRTIFGTSDAVGPHCRQASSVKNNSRPLAVSPTSHPSPAKRQKTVMGSDDRASIVHGSRGRGGATRGRGRAPAGAATVSHSTLNPPTQTQTNSVESVDQNIRINSGRPPVVDVPVTHVQPSSSPRQQVPVTTSNTPPLPTQHPVTSATRPGTIPTPSVSNRPTTYRPISPPLPLIKR